MDGKTILRFVRFLAVGGLGAVAYVLFSYLLTLAGTRPWIASVVVYSCLIPIVYVAHRRFVFESERAHTTAFPRYVAIQLLSLSLSVVVPWAFEAYGIHPVIAFLSVAIGAALTSYVLQSRWAFAQDRQGPDSDR